MRIKLIRSYSPVIIDMLVNFMMLGVAVVPQELSSEAWMELAEVADYFCLLNLRNICESQLCNKVSADNSARL